MIDIHHWPIIKITKDVDHVKIDFFIDKEMLKPTSITVSGTNDVEENFKYALELVELIRKACED